jgi:hypothetical protein
MYLSAHHKQSFTTFDVVYTEQKRTEVKRREEYCLSIVLIRVFYLFGVLSGMLATNFS